MQNRALGELSDAQLSQSIHTGNAANAYKDALRVAQGIFVHHFKGRGTAGTAML
ncbi:MAG TPA: hypothetical protein V6C78_29630 [Crinalium sp.]